MEKLSGGEQRRVQNRGRSDRYGDQGAANDYTTFFFSNFSNGLGELDMLKVFQKRARVKEVFISRRLNKWGRRFGFVRLFGVSNVGGLEKELDQLYIGNRKLFVNVPKYQRHQPALSRIERRNLRAPYLVSQKESMKHQ